MATKRWISVHARPGGTFVTVTLLDGPVSCKVTEKTYAPDLRRATVSAQARAHAMLKQIQEFPHV